jgi:hypothetical protein
MITFVINKKKKKLFTKKSDLIRKYLSFQSEYQQKQQNIIQSLTMKKNQKDFNKLLRNLFCN